MIETKCKIVDIKIAYHCNNLCRFCVAGDKREAYPDMSMGQLVEIMTENRTRCDEIVFTGGEPTVHPQILELVRIAREDLGFKTIQIQSNGRMFVYKDFCERIVGAGANQFAISVHGHNVALHDYLTGRPGSFVETVSGIRNLLKMDQRVATNTVITKPGYRHLPEIAELLIALGLRQFMFSYPHIIGVCERNAKSIAPQMSLVIPYLRRAILRADRANRVSLVEAIPQCMLPGLEQHIMEMLHSKRTVVDWNESIEDYFGHRKNYIKIKGPQCERCKVNKDCDGVWPDYPENFSWEEFVPCDDDKI